MGFFTEKWGFWPGLEGFFGVFDDGVELLLTGLRNPTQELLGDWISDWISFSVFSFDEFTIDEVFIDSGEGISLESSEEWHKFSTRNKN